MSRENRMYGKASRGHKLCAQELMPTFSAGTLTQFIGWVFVGQAIQWLLGPLLVSPFAVRFPRLPDPSAWQSMAIRVYTHIPLAITQTLCYISSTISGTLPESSHGSSRGVIIHGRCAISSRLHCSLLFHRLPTSYGKRALVFALVSKQPRSTPWDRFWDCLIQCPSSGPATQNPSPSLLSPTAVAAGSSIFVRGRPHKRHRSKAESRLVWVPCPIATHRIQNYSTEFQHTDFSPLSALSSAA